MRRRNAFLIACTLAIACFSHARAQEPNTARSLSTRQKWARFAVVRGRVTVFVTRGQGGAAWTEEQPGGAIESFGICCEDDGIKLRFERSSADSTVLMQFFDARDFTLTRMPKSAGIEALHFVQPAHGDVRLIVGAGNDSRTISAPSLWHLLLAEPQVCRQELLPLLEHLRHNWRLAEQADQLQQRLLACESAAAPPDWQNLVAQLGDSHFRVRQAADRALRGLGQSVLPFLESLDPQQLSPEQRVRVREICEAIAETNEDVPLRVVAWLVNDGRLWQRLAMSNDAAWRSLAQRHQARLQQDPDEAQQQQTVLAANKKDAD